MKKALKRIMATLTVAIMTFGTVTTAMAAAVSPEGPQTLPLYGSFTGVVKEILPSDRSADAVQKVIVIHENGGEAMFMINRDTLWVTDVTAVEVGDTVTGFFDGRLPMIMIYPPQYTIEVMAVNVPDGMEVTVDRFDDELMSTDGALQLRIGEHTEVLDPEGDMFKGETIANRLLVVFHDPAETNGRTTAWKIIVMYEKAVTLPIDISGTPIYIDVPLTLNGEIVVEGEIIAAPAPFVCDSGVVMVPLRAVAEGLGFTLHWEDAAKTIMLNNTISLTIGKDYYTFARMAPIELGAAPELVDETTYVPLNFFTDVARMNNAYVLEGQVVVDNMEKME